MSDANHTEVNPGSALSELSAELAEHGLQVRLRSSGHGEELVATNPTAQLTETVRVHDGDFVWRWKQMICPATMPALAATRISRVLGEVRG